MFHNEKLRYFDTNFHVTSVKQEQKWFQMHWAKFLP